MKWSEPSRTHLLTPKDLCSGFCWGGTVVIYVSNHTDKFGFVVADVTYTGQLSFHPLRKTRSRDFRLECEHNRDGDITVHCDSDCSIAFKLS